MFYLRYLRNELVRRRARTILTALGLGLGVALVIVIAGVSSGLDKAQKKTLNPLAGIGTDLTVTLTPTQQDTGGFRRPGGGGGNRDLIQSNLSVVTDLSKLGKPGTHFVHDFFLPGTQLTFKQSAAKQISSIAGVAQVTPGPDAARRASGGRRAEDRRDAEDAGEDDHADASRASVRGRLREDAGLPGEGRDQLRPRQR